MMGTDLPIMSIKIALVALNYTPERFGIGPFAGDLAAGLRERGHRVDVVAGYPHYPQWKLLGDFADCDAAAMVQGIKITRRRHFIPSRPSLLKRSLMETSFGFGAARSRIDDADLVLCISPPLLATAAMLLAERLRRRTRPTVVWVQDLYGMGVAETRGPGSIAAKAALALESKTFRSATALAVIHDRFKTHVVDALGVEADRVGVFPNWSRQEPIPAVGRAQAVQQLGWESLEDHVLVLHAGSMGVKQGLENVVQAATMADRIPEKVMFVLLGDGNQRPRLEALAAGVKSVRFIDVLDDRLFGYALRAADILMLNQQAAISDMCVPSKMMSYYSAGRPLLAAVNADGITASEVAESRAGVVVPPMDPACLLKEVLALAEDVSARERMEAAGPEFVRRKFQRAATIDAMSEWLVNLVARPDDSPTPPSKATG